MSPEMLKSHSRGPFGGNKKYNPWKSLIIIIIIIL